MLEALMVTILQVQGKTADRERRQEHSLLYLVQLHFQTHAYLPICNCLIGIQSVNAYQYYPKPAHHFIVITKASKFCQSFSLNGNQYISYNLFWRTEPVYRKARLIGKLPVKLRKLVRKVCIKQPICKSGEMYMLCTLDKYSRP